MVILTDVVVEEDEVEDEVEDVAEGAVVVDAVETIIIILIITFHAHQVEGEDEEAMVVDTKNDFVNRLV